MQTIYVEFNSDKIYSISHRRQSSESILLFTREVSSWKVFSMLIKIRFFLQFIYLPGVLVAKFDDLQSLKLIRYLQYVKEETLFNYIWNNQKPIIWDYWLKSRTVDEINKSGIIPFLKILYHEKELNGESNKLDSFWEEYLKQSKRLK